MRLLLLKSMSLLSLLLCVATVVLWVRSYGARDALERFVLQKYENSEWNTDDAMYSADGLVLWVHHRHPEDHGSPMSEEVRWHWYNPLPPRARPGAGAKRPHGRSEALPAVAAGDFHQLVTGMADVAGSVAHGWILLAHSAPGLLRWLFDPSFGSIASMVSQEGSLARIVLHLRLQPDRQHQRRLPGVWHGLYHL